MIVVDDIVDLSVAISSDAEVVVIAEEVLDLLGVDLDGVEEM